ncbi:ABC transporter permease [Rhizobium alvei]|uniref:Transport permease protein n=1 Tax=Rhizobium alvei TaxID=1132659 RepID=A0ABT8YHG2_9HYPH|nr:ABC transporter permease [Rhizobium alvei]MDO6962695.1 ABC transporter permease [Rhizobium alvei]
MDSVGRHAIGLWDGARMNGRVLVALIFRDSAQRFGDGPAGYIWTLVEPSMLIAIMLVMRVSIKNYTPAFGESSIMFLLTGLLAYRICRNTINKASRAIIANRPLLAFGPVKPIDVVFAKTIVEFTIWLIVLTIFFSAVRRILQQEVITSFQGFVLALLAMFYFCLAMSTFNATIGALLPIWKSIWRIMSVPLLLTSGVLYVPSTMPPEMLSVIQWNPVLHCVEALRSASYLDYLSIYDPVYLFSFSTITLLLSLIIEMLFRKEIIRSRDDGEEDEEEL